MVLHGPSLHFHLGAWAVTAIATFIAFWLTFLNQSGLLKEDLLSKKQTDHYVDQLDFVAHVTGIVGLLGIILAGITGLMDAYTWENPNKDGLDQPLEAILEGYDISAKYEVLAFKVAWTIVGTYCFIFAGIIRLYFVNYRHERVYDQHSAIQVLYAEALMLGFLIMVAIAGAGGIWTYGESILERAPIFEGFLPGRGGYLLFVTALALMLGGTLVTSSLLVKAPPKTSSPDPVNKP
ncbi:MAG: hypothetical protein ACXAB4_04460 [Candidatus Hodarchaeales archaeon]|jgi:hypothetical protein